MKLHIIRIIIITTILLLTPMKTKANPPMELTWSESIAYSENRMQQAMIDRWNIEIDPSKEIVVVIEEKKKVVSPKPEITSSKGAWLNYRVTAYINTPEENGGTYNGKVLTSLGHDITKNIYHDDLRIIAVNPKVIPYGSIVEIKSGDKVIKAHAIDTGGAMRNNNDLIDLLVDDHNYMRKWGVKKCKVRIIGHKKYRK